MGGTSVCISCSVFLVPYLTLKDSVVVVGWGGGGSSFSACVKTLRERLFGTHMCTKCYFAQRL